MKVKKLAKTSVTKLNVPHECNTLEKKQTFEVWHILYILQFW